MTDPSQLCTTHEGSCGVNRYGSLRGNPVSKMMRPVAMCVRRLLSLSGWRPMRSPHARANSQMNVAGVGCHLRDRDGGSTRVGCGIAVVCGIADTRGLEVRRHSGAVRRLR